METVNDMLLDYVIGDATGIEIPAHAQALRDYGADFLTKAFHAFGSLGEDNRVLRISRYESFPGGNSGHKLCLWVEYARREPGLHDRLFVKFSRDFADAHRDRRRYELEAEVRLAALSRLPKFPIRVPEAYFADFHHPSGTGILITEQVAFGEGEIEPLTPKCMDYELRDPLEYYRATITALARLAAAHKNGVLSPDSDRLFPFDPLAAVANDTIRWDGTRLVDRLAQFADFATRCPQLLPDHLTTPDFIARFRRGTQRIQQHEVAIRRFLHSRPDLISLCHWNAHLDNAFFWRDAAGALQCGLLDWGRVRQFNLVYALWGCLCGAELALWDEHLDELLILFIDEYHAGGGPKLDFEEVKLHLDLYIAMIGLVEVMNTPELVMTRLPEAADAFGLRDQIFRENELPRVVLHIFMVYLHVWQTHDCEGQLERMLALCAAP